MAAGHWHFIPEPGENLRAVRPGAAYRLTRQHWPGHRAGTDAQADGVAWRQGIGLSSQNLERIFELFVQERPIGLHGNTGLGIGLALTRKLMALHGGRVWAESAGPGHGSTFRIELPAASPAAPSLPETPAHAPDDAPG